jgi:hypothetical protein
MVETLSVRLCESLWLKTRFLSMIQPATPRRGELLAIAIFAIALRITVFASAMLRGHLTLDRYTAKGDTASYIANAAAMCGERPLASLTDYDIRVFPGYPALIAIAHRNGIPLPMSALCVTWISAGIAAAVAGRVFADARVGWAMTCLIPHYLINSSLGMSEAPVLAVVCLALLCSQHDRLIPAGILFAFAGMIRPMACFALAGLLFALLRDRQWKSITIVLATTALTFALELGALQRWTGDVLRGIHAYANHPGAYAGHLLAWPFQSLLTTPAIDSASAGRILYTWIHVATTFTACAWIAIRIIRGNPCSSRDRVAAPWLIGNTAFVLCIGSVWGFRHFPRFTIPAAPAMFWTLRSLLPRRARWWMLIATACGVAAAAGVIDSK